MNKAKAVAIVELTPAVEKCLTEKQDFRKEVLERNFLRGKGVLDKKSTKKQVSSSTRWYTDLSKKRIVNKKKLKIFLDLVFSKYGKKGKPYNSFGSFVYRGTVIPKTRIVDMLNFMFSKEIYCSKNIKHVNIMNRLMKEIKFPTIFCGKT